jgi:hypothetical protein
MRTLLLFVLLSGSGLFAQDNRFFQTKTPAGKQLWRASISALATANMLDIDSSWGKHELNGLLANRTGTFGTQGALIKLGIQGSFVGMQYLITRRHPSARLYRALAFINFGASAGIAGVAAHNYGVPTAGR